MEHTNLTGPGGAETAHTREDTGESHRPTTQEPDIPSIYRWFGFFSIAVIVGGVVLAAVGGVSVWQGLHSRRAALDLSAALPTIAAGVAATWIGLLGLVLIDLRRVVRTCHVVTFSLPTVVANRMGHPPSVSTGSQCPEESPRPVLVNVLALALQRLRR